MGNGLLYIGVSAIQRVQRIAVIHLFQEHTTQTGVPCIKVQHQHFHSQVRKLDGQVRKNRGFSLVLRGRSHINTGIGGCSESLLKDMRDRRIIVHYNGVAFFLIFRLIEKVPILAEVAFPFRDLSQQFQAQLIFHITDVQQRGMEQQIQNCHAHTQKRPQNRHIDPDACIQAAANNVLGAWFIDDRNIADLQGTNQDIRQHAVNGVQNRNTFLCTAPVEIQFNDLCRVVLGHFQVTVDIFC